MEQAEILEILDKRQEAKVQKQLNGDSQKPAESPHLSPQQVKVLTLGMTPKEVLHTQGNLWIKDHSTRKITKIPLGLFPYSPDQ